MNSEDDIPLGFAVSKEQPVEPEYNAIREVINRTDILDEVVAVRDVQKTSQDFGRGRRSSRVEIRAKERYKSKAVSEQYGLRESEKGGHELGDVEQQDRE